MTDPTPWYAEHDELVHFADVLVDAEWLDRPHDVVYFFEKPWKWDPQHQLWEQADRPTAGAGAAWDAFVELLDTTDANDDRPPVVGL